MKNRSKLFVVHRGKLYRKPGDKDDEASSQPRLVVMLESTYSIIKRVHEAIGPHAGVKRIWIEVQRLYYGINREEVPWIIRHCTVCKGKTPRERKSLVIEFGNDNTRDVGTQTDLERPSIETMSVQHNAWPESVLGEQRSTATSSAPADSHYSACYTIPASHHPNQEPDLPAFRSSCSNAESSPPPRDNPPSYGQSTPFSRVGSMVRSFFSGGHNDRPDETGYVGSRHEASSKLQRLANLPRTAQSEAVRKSDAGNLYPDQSHNDIQGEADISNDPTVQSRGIQAKPHGEALETIVEGGKWLSSSLSESLPNAPASLNQSLTPKAVQARESDSFDIRERKPRRIDSAFGSNLAKGSKGAETP